MKRIIIEKVAKASFLSDGWHPSRSKMEFLQQCLTYGMYNGFLKIFRNSVL